MVSGPTRSFLNTILVVMGALIIGQMLNVTVVTGQEPLFAPIQLAKVVAGVALIAIGRVVHNPVREAERRYQARESQRSGEEEEFDPEMSPVGGELEHVDSAGEEE